MLSGNKEYDQLFDLTGYDEWTDWDYYYDEEDPSWISDYTSWYSYYDKNWIPSCVNKKVGKVLDFKDITLFKDSLLLIQKDISESMKHYLSTNKEDNSKILKNLKLFESRYSNIIETHFDQLIKTIESANLIEHLKHIYINTLTMINWYIELLNTWVYDLEVLKDLWVDIIEWIDMIIKFWIFCSSKKWLEIFDSFFESEFWELEDKGTIVAVNTLRKFLKKLDLY